MIPQDLDANFWNVRYGGADYVYGTEPNEFVVAVAARIPEGPVLCLAEGEGRNAVHLASRGHAVTAVDLSEVGLAKARQLAASKGVPLTTIAADLTQFPITPNSWSGIVTSFGHLPSALRRQVYSAAVAGLKPGGVFILEAYAKGQLGRGTGGPTDLDLLMSAEALRGDLAGLDFEILRELERNVTEGAKHRGWGMVVQVLARKPSSNRI